VREGAQWDAALQTTVAAFGQLDVLVNNAGIIHTGYARDLTMAQHRDMVEVNYLGVIGGVMAALPLMREQGHGHIVDVCSMTSFLPLTGYATYGGTKHAMRAFQHSVAIEERGGPVALPSSTRRR
jgi:NADP-dependent 3-hydroxy acid dehydrogenase YdfG